ncbi:MAG: molecular chaperone DnaJ [Christensenellales bacterium]
MSEKDYYKLLGVERNASADEIKQAYRKMAKKYHPDLYSTASDEEKKKAEAQFKEINHAYEVLSDPQKKEIYDRYGDENASAFGGSSGFGGFSGGFDDIFSSIFSGFGGMGGGRTRNPNAPRRGQDILINVNLTFEEAAFGCKKKITVKRIENCPDCKGTGAKNGSSFKTCDRCHGSGQINQTQRTPFGVIQQVVTCPDCGGKGRIVSEVCPTCGGKARKEVSKEITINIPAGIDNGQRINYAGEGNQGMNGGENGSLIAQISVKTHKLFVRRDYDLHVNIPISMIDAALGCTISVPTLTTPTTLDIPAGTQSGTVFKIRGQGIKQLKKTTNGDLVVTVTVEVPKSLTKTQKDEFKKLQSTFENKQFPMQKEYKDKL